MAEDPTRRILITNDDGVQAPGLMALAQALRPVAEVTIIAPDHNWSAASHSKTMHKPLRVWPTRLADGSEALVSSGSPTDCVALALLGLISQRPDLIVSGINQGANLGHDVTYSGTVAGAMEGVIGGVSGVAVSLDSYDAEAFDVAARFAALLARQVLTRIVQAPLLLNVNVPALPEEQIAGVRITRLGNRHYRDALVERTDPRGRSYYWIGGEPLAVVPESGTDVDALAAGCISVTPILLDLTDHARLPELRGWDLAFPSPE